MAATLIVGAGPAGLTLALSLVKNGVPVRIIEKSSSHPVGQRGSGMHPRTLELYKTLGILPEIQAMAGEVQPILILTSPEGPEPVAVIDMIEKLEETPAYPIVNSVALGQDRQGAIIRAVLAREYDTHVELGTELKSFEQHEEYVEARLVKHIEGQEVEEVIKTEFLVGTDGARSVVRKQLGLTFLGESHQEFGMVVGDLHIKSGIPDRKYWRSWGDQRKAFVALRPWESDEDRYSLVLGGSEVDLSKLSNDREALYKYISALIGRELDYGELIWSGIWSPNIRMVDKFGVGRVFVAGGKFPILATKLLALTYTAAPKDAAHVHSPTGAQGMNSSVQDSINLAWKIGLVHKKLAPLSLLSSYTDERRPVIAAMLKETTSVMNKTFRGDKEYEGVDGEHWRRGFELRQLGINYRGSPLVVDEKNLERVEGIDSYRGGLDGTLKGGDRAPAAPGLVNLGVADNSTMALFDLLSPSKHTILIFPGSDEKCVEAIVASKAVFPEGTSQIAVIYPRAPSFPGSTTDSNAESDVHYSLIDKEGYAHKHYKFIPRDKYRVFVIRPDGYIGAIVEGDSEGLKTYGRLVFGF